MQADRENECIFYQNGADHFMEKVLSSHEYIILPVPPAW